MGNMMDKPNTDKSVQTAEGNDLRSGLSAMQGWRMTMEDNHVMEPSFNGTACGFFGVFDGHGGDFVSNYIANNIGAFLSSQPEYKAAPLDAEQMTIALQKCYLDIDIELRVTDPVCTGADHSGSTAVTVFITPTHIICANTGDSRACLYSGTDAITLSFDHKPYNDSERIRIMEAGGTVINKRVNGDLAVSRCIGDFTFKLRSDLPMNRQMVSPLPDIIIQERCKEDKFVVLACDGIWDVMTNDEVCDIVSQDLLHESEITQVANNVIMQCLDRGSRDNMSVMIVCFPNSPKPIPRLVEERERERRNGVRKREKYSEKSSL